MEALFLKVLSMSATAAVVILVVLLARLPLRRAPKVFSYALWAVVLFRLLCPFVIQIPWSLTPSIQVEQADEWRPAVEFNAERVEVVIRVDDSPAIRPEPAPSDVPAGPPDSQGAPVQAAAPGFSAWAAAGIVWLAGAALLLGYGAVSLLLLRRRLVGTVPLEGEKGVRLADHIPSPFVLGLLWPKIYLPSDLPEGERDYVLLHERTHIRRCDHIFRGLAWLALAVHWFNPLVWLAFHLAGKDMEMSCDETVLRKMGRDVRADYSTSLLRLSTGKRLPAGPLAFGAGDPKSRIKNVLSYKKPALWVMVIALVAVLCAGVALATNRADSDVPAFDPDSVDADLTFSLEDVGNGPLVRIAGTAGDVELSRVVWRPEGLDALFGEHPGGELSMAEYKTGSWGAWITAWWTDEGRTSVTMSTLMSAMLSSQSNAGWWEFTVDLGSGAVTEMTAQADPADRVYLYPESISDEEAVKAARIAAKLLTAAEDWYLRQTAPAANLTFSLDESGGLTLVRVNGSVGGEALTQEAFWYPENVWNVWSENPQGELSMAYPAFAEGVNGHIMAWWTDESRASVTVTTQTIATSSGYAPAGWWTFTVDVKNGTVTEMAPSKWADDARVPAKEVRYYPTSISDEEAVRAARIAAKLLTAAEDYYNNVSARLDSEEVWMEVWTATPTSLECFIENDTRRELTFGEDYSLQVEDGGVWRDVEEETPMDFVAVAHVLGGSKSHIVSVSFPVDLGSRYGELPPGHYRILKEAHLEREDVTLSAEFEIEG